jgi:hypothetical protein
MRGFWAYRNAGVYEIFELKSKTPGGRIKTGIYLFYIIRDKKLEFNIEGKNIRISKTDSRNYHPLNTLSTLTMKGIVIAALEGNLSEIPS